MSDEGEDYMSDKFLSAAIDVRASLIKDRAKKRQVDVKEKQNANIKKQREERYERAGAKRNQTLQEALQRPIEAKNKGFQMLAKMGYKPGQVLGRNDETTAAADDASKTSSNRLTEPIGIQIKMDRGGLGREAALRELNAKRQQLRAQHLREAVGGHVLTAQEYRAREMLKAEERYMHGALRRCQQSCANLDNAANVETPEMSWFWPEVAREADADDLAAETGTVEEVEAQDEDDKLSDAEKFALLYNYLRTAYLFCFWCGVKYEHLKDMQDNCPGLTRDDH